MGGTLGAGVRTAKRVELLGGLGQLRSGELRGGAGLGPPALRGPLQPPADPALKVQLLLEQLHTMADGQPGGRAITVGSELTAILTDPDGTLPPTHVLASLATPSLTGVEKSDFVTARDPALDATAAGERGAIALRGRHRHSLRGEP